MEKILGFIGDNPQMLKRSLLDLGHEPPQNKVWLSKSERGRCFIKLGEAYNMVGQSDALVQSRNEEVGLKPMAPSLLYSGSNKLSYCGSPFPLSFFPGPRGPKH